MKTGVPKTLQASGVILKVQNKYTNRNFTITDYHGDNEFDKSALKDFLEPALINTYGRK